MKGNGSWHCPNGRQGIIRRREAAGKGAAVSANGQVRRAAGALAGTGRGAGRNREAQRHERPVEGVLQETPLDGPKKHPGVDCQSPLPPPWKGGTSLGESHDPPLCVPPPFSRAWSEPLPSLESATDATGERAAAAVPVSCGDVIRKDQAPARIRRSRTRISPPYAAKHLPSSTAILLSVDGGLMC